ncbi:PQQ-like beta-propeller repeat protein [Opitutia bacterium ISCC 51]|nr:PQQ-like beta-propeller repeat protein [Opitutae bacterium ISCC 51]QXD29127.1 PQQ-like beta-propeller repeat protein [Opitutae bacterium ISCC 52]
MKLTIIIVLCLGFATLSQAADWPKWLGPNGKNVWNEKGVVSSIPDEGLKTLWEFEVGLGYGGPSVAKGKVYLMDYLYASGDINNNPGSIDELKGQERILCIDAASGELIWKYAYDRQYNMSYPSGPRSTPTVVDGKVYALGAEGNLTVLDADNGDLIWKKDFIKEYGAETPVWGFSAHPYVNGDTVYCIVGGEGSVVVAFDKDSGEDKWKALSSTSQGYCPPTIIKHAGLEQLIVWHPEAVNGLDPQTGEVFWTEELKPSWGGSIQVPRKLGNQLFVAGPGAAALYDLKQSGGNPAVEMVWRGNPRNAFYPVNSPVIFDTEAIYGVDSNSSSLTAIDREDGSWLWQSQVPALAEVNKRERHGTAFLVRHRDSDLYFVLSESGDLILAEITTDGYKELGREKILEPTNSTGGRPVVWSHPAFARKAIFARNDKKLVAVDLNSSNYN